MVNIEDFIKRLEIILDYYNLSASAFADKVGVQRSSLSHLLSGRNKPSLDLILKIVSEFPEVDLYWIVNGKGNFPKSENQNVGMTSAPISQNFQQETKFENQPDLFSTEPSVEKNRVDEISEEKFSNTRILESVHSNQDIDRIVIFFKDGTFKSYRN
ncbi:MAG: helix-turn-helix transcriptional regulator [Bacteroidota bacterium]